MITKFYDDAFLRAWRAYGGRGSKAKAYIAWNKTALQRPNEAMMLCCIAAYLEDVNAYNKGRKSDQQRDKLHFSTFLSERDMRWESYMDRAEVILRSQKAISAGAEASVSASSQTWPESVLKALRSRLSEPVLTAWFLPCVYVPSDPPEIIAPKKFHANWLMNNYPQHLERAIGGEFKITYAA